MSALSPAAVTKAKLTVEDFVLLHEHGAFAGYAKTELLDGEVYTVNAQWTPHALAKTRLATELAFALRALGSPLEPVTEVSVRLSATSLPRPDIMLTDYDGGGPVPLERVALLIEISDTTLVDDLGRKAQLYAAAGVREYWVIDLAGGRALLHEQPSADGYGARREQPLGGALTAVTVAGLTVSSARLV